jgi:hypothetical protein
MRDSTTIFDWHDGSFMNTCEEWMQDKPWFISGQNGDSNSSQAIFFSLKHQHGQGMGVSWTTNMNSRMNIVVGEPPVGKYSDCWDGVWQYEQWHTTSSCVLSAKKTQSEFMIIAVRFYCSILGVEMHTQRIGLVGNLWMFGAPFWGLTQYSREGIGKNQTVPKKMLSPVLDFPIFPLINCDNCGVLWCSINLNPNQQHLLWWYEAVKPTDFGEKALEKCPLARLKERKRGCGKRSERSARIPKCGMRLSKLADICRYHRCTWCRV